MSAGWLDSVINVRRRRMDSSGCDVKVWPLVRRLLPFDLRPEHQDRVPDGHVHLDRAFRASTCLLSDVCSAGTGEMASRVGAHGPRLGTDSEFLWPSCTSDSDGHQLGRAPRLHRRLSSTGTPEGAMERARESHGRSASDTERSMRDVTWLGEGVRKTVMNWFRPVM